MTWTEGISVWKTRLRHFGDALAVKMKNARTLFEKTAEVGEVVTVTVGGGIAALSVSYDSCKRPEEPRRYRRVPRCIARRRAWVVPSPRHVGAAPRRDKFGGLRDMSSTLAQ